MDTKAATKTAGWKNIQAEIYNNFEELETIQPEWDEFVESVGGEIFLTFDWCRIWWKHYGKNRDLKILLFRSNRNLVGILPLFFERIWLGLVSVRTGKIVGSDFTISHFSLPILQDFIPAVTERLWDVLSEEKCDILCIGLIAGLYKYYDRLTELLAESLPNGYNVYGQKKYVHTYFELPDNWDGYLAGLSKNQRKKYRKSYKAAGDLSVELFAGQNSHSDFAEAFENFVKMHQKRWNKDKKPGHFQDWPGSREFHFDVASSQMEQNRLRLLKIKLGNSTIGYKYGYKFGKKHIAFLDARTVSEVFDHMDLGRILFGELVKMALNEGVSYIDSMQCKYDHKMRLGGRLLQMKAIYIARKSPLAELRIGLFRLLSRLLDLVYFKIWYCRIASRLPIKRKPLWRIWIRSNAFAG